MKIEIHDKANLTFVPETRKELLDALDVHGVPMDSDEYFNALASFTQGNPLPMPLVAPRSATEGNGGWVRYTGTTSYLNAYWELMEKALGAQPFDIDIHPAFRSTVTHTDYVERVWHDAEAKQTFYTYVFCVYPRQGQKFLEESWFDIAASQEGARRIASDLGSIVPVPEYLELPNGFYKHNPAWGRSETKYRADIGNPAVLLYMANQWLERYATTEQREVVARIHRSDSKQLDWFHNRNHGDQFLLDNCNSAISFADFKKLI